MVYVFLAEGFEEIEALTPVDVLRRGGVEVKTVGVQGREVTGSHGITVKADIFIDECTFENLQAVILPGGMPGTINLEKSYKVINFIDFAAEKGIIIGAICAAPSILGRKGLLASKKATCFNGFEKELKSAIVVNEPSVRDGNIITSWGAGGAFDFAFELLAAITDDSEKASELRKSMRCVDNKFLRGKISGR